MAGYRYTISYKSTHDHGNADGLSRLPSGCSSPDESSTAQADLFNISQIEVLPVTARELSLQTKRDPVLGQISNLVMNGWPASVDRNSPITPFYIRRNQMLVLGNACSYSTQLERVMQELHQDHLNIVKMKSVARLYCWWPDLDSDIENLGRSCPSCQREGKSPTCQHITSMGLAITTNATNATSTFGFCRFIYGSFVSCFCQ